jgi:regulator of replication initiation timing
MYFSESIRAINAIHILDRNFQNLLEQCEKAKEELVRLRNENEQLKKELNDQRKRNSEEVARNESGTNNGSTVTIT